MDESNLQRQVVHTAPDVGRRKTASARDAVHRLNPLVQVVVHDLRLDATNAIDTLRGYDLTLARAAGFDAVHLDGGILAWIAKEGAVVRG